MAEEFIAKQARIEKEGKKVEVIDLNTLPIFHANYHPKENVVKIKCSAGNLTLKKGIFFYGYSGKHKGIVITARCYVKEGKIEQIVYEEFDELNNIKITINYYKNKI